MIHINGLTFSIGRFRLRAINLDVASGEYYVLMGPTGSGKSMLLECLCGLKQIEEGCVVIDGQDVTHVEPRRRAVGYVPQDYALFPHQTVYENIAFGLRRRRLDRGVIQHKVLATADLLGIGNLVTRRIAGLSGGEQQRVAIARAIVTEPKVLVLDEPVSALDESMRREICGELRRLHRQLGIATLHVCHNREEAFSVADRGAVLCDGGIQQLGTIPELLRQPRNEFVARFMCCENLYEANADTNTGDAHGSTLQVGPVVLTGPSVPPGKVKFIVRPEKVHLERPETRPRQQNQFHGTIIQIRDCGAYMRVELNGPLRLVGYLSHAAFAELGADIGHQVAATIRSDAIHVLGS